MELIDIVGQYDWSVNCGVVRHPCSNYHLNKELWWMFVNYVVISQRSLLCSSQMEVALLSKCVLNLQRCNFKFRLFGRDTNLPLAIFLVELILKVKIEVYQDMNI
jgi:hypothetical protein